MTTQQQAKVKVEAAAKGCAVAEQGWRAALEALDSSVSTNG